MICLIGFSSSIVNILSAVFIDYLFVGACIATLGWAIANRYMRISSFSHSHSHSTYAVEQSVEWLYAFDVHCNAFFPLFILLFVLQFFLSPMLLMESGKTITPVESSGAMNNKFGETQGAAVIHKEGFLPVFFSNVLYLFAGTYYHYLTFLGYNALPFLEKTEYFLYPIGILLLLFPLALLSNFNPTRFVLSLFFS